MIENEDTPMLQEEKFFGVKTFVEDVEDASNDDDDFEIDVVDDRPKEDRRPASATREPADDEEDDLTKYSANVQKRIARMKHDFHEERRAKDQAIRIAEEATRFAKKVRSDSDSVRTLVQSSHQELVAQAQGRARASLDLADRNFRAAHESGSSDEISKASQEMVAAQLAMAEAPGISGKIVKAWQETARRTQAESPPELRPMPQVPEPSPDAIDWQKKNQWFGKDRVMTSTAYGVHEELVSEGVDPNSLAYYGEINARMRLIFPEKFGDTSGAQNQESRFEVETARGPKRAVSVVAPVTRGNGAKPRKVTLTATQVQVAKRLGITPQQYAAQLFKESR